MVFTGSPRRESRLEQAELKGGAPATTTCPIPLAMLAIAHPVLPPARSVYGNNLHGNSEVNLHGCRDLGEVGPLSSDILPYQDSGDQREATTFSQKLVKNLPAWQGSQELPYEELWLEEAAQPSTLPSSLSERADAVTSLGSVRSKCATSPFLCPGAGTRSEICRDRPTSRLQVPPQIRDCKSFLFWGWWASSVSLLSPLLIYFLS